MDLISQQNPRLLFNVFDPMCACAGKGGEGVKGEVRRVIRVNLDFQRPVLLFAILGMNEID